VNRRSRLLVGLLFVTATVGYICRVNVSVTGALFMEEFGLSQVDMGSLFSAFLLGYSIMQIPGGMLADRWGAARVLGICAGLWGLLTALQAAAGIGPLRGGVLALGFLLVLRFVLGVSQAPTFTSAAQGIGEWVPAGARARANGVVIAAVGLGSALAPPLLTAVMTRWGWRSAMVASALPPLVAALVWRRIRDGRKASGDVKAEAGLIRNLQSRDLVGNCSARGRLLRSRSFLLLTASYTLQGYVGYIFVFWFYLYLVQERHFDLLSGALWSSLPWIFSIISIPLGGYISDRLVVGKLGWKWGRRLVPLVGLTGAGILLATGARTDHPYVAAACLGLSTALVLCVEGPFWASMMQLAGESRGTAGGIMNTGCNLGGLISPALTPWLAARFGWQNALFLAAGISILGAVLWLWISPPAPATSSALVSEAEGDYSP